jgi:hypothetical protein
MQRLSDYYDGNKSTIKFQHIDSGILTFFTPKHVNENNKGPSIKWLIEGMAPEYFRIPQGQSMKFCDYLYHEDEANEILINMLSSGNYRLYL